MKPQRGFSLVELIILTMICVVIAITFLVSSAGSRDGLTMGDGDRVGIVTKLSHRGVFWKTWEGQLILGGQGTVTTNVWEFSIIDPQLRDEIKKALDTQTKVRLSYHQNLLPRPWNGSTKYFITAVNVIEEKK